MAASSKDTANRAMVSSRAMAPRSMEAINSRDTVAAVMEDLAGMEDISSRLRLRSMGLVLVEVRLWGWEGVCWAV